MNPLRLRTVAGALAASFIMTSFALAEDDISQLKQQVDELDQKIRVLQAEHILYPQALRLLASGRVRCDGEKIVVSEDVNNSPPLYAPAI